MREVAAETSGNQLLGSVVTEVFLSYLSLETLARGLVLCEEPNTDNGQLCSSHTQRLELILYPSIPNPQFSLASSLFLSELLLSISNLEDLKDLSVKKEPYPDSM